MVLIQSVMQLIIKGHDWLINSLPYNYSQLQGEAFILLHQQHVWVEPVQAIPPTNHYFF